MLRKRFKCTVTFSSKIELVNDGNIKRPYLKDEITSTFTNKNDNIDKSLQLSRFLRGLQNIIMIRQENIQVSVVCIVQF